MTKSAVTKAHDQCRDLVANWGCSAALRDDTGLLRDDYPNSSEGWLNLIDAGATEVANRYQSKRNDPLPRK